MVLVGLVSSCLQQFPKSQNGICVYDFESAQPSSATGPNRTLCSKRNDFINKPKWEKCNERKTDPCSWESNIIMWSTEDNGYRGRQCGPLLLFCGMLNSRVMVGGGHLRTGWHRKCFYRIFSQKHCPSASPPTGTTYGRTRALSFQLTGIKEVRIGSMRWIVRTDVKYWQLWE